jgi:hypothetical protein
LVSQKRIQREWRLNTVFPRAFIGWKNEKNHGRNRKINKGQTYETRDKNQNSGMGTGSG